MVTELYLLAVPPQPRYNVGEQRVYCCRSCGEHFIVAAGMGWLELARLDGSQACELHYRDVCEDSPEVAR